MFSPLFFLKNFRFSYFFGCGVVAFMTILSLSAQSASHEPEGKKGIGLVESQGGNAQLLELLKVHWYYNWGATSQIKTSIPFVPMAFSIKRIDDVSDKLNVVLGFNEPDNSKQSDIDVADALKAWSRLVAKAQKIGAPAMAKDATKEGNWLPQFMASHPKVDFVTVHWYKGVDAKKFIKDIQKVCDTYQKPVWVTEFAPQTASDSRDDPSRFSQTDVNEFIIKTTQWMEKSSCVAHYAWHDSKVGTSSLIQDGKLTETGKTYAAIK